MKKTAIALLALSAVLCAGAKGPKKPATPKDDKVITPESTGFTFTDVVIVPNGTVKDQNKSGTCWSFSSTGFIEDEVRRLHGKDVDLSEMWTVRKCYNDKAQRFVRLYGQTLFAPGGSMADVLYVLKNYGMVPEEAYGGLQYGEEKHDHSEMHDALSGFVTAVAKKPGKRLTTAWPKAIDGIMDAYMGPVPETFVYEGVTYTPRSFADSLGVNVDDYISVTSFTHHPFYTAFPIEVPDNWVNANSWNIPMEEMKEVVDNALNNGMTVAWAADVSEGGFKWNKGYAVIPKGKDTGDMSGTELSRWVQLSDKDREAERYDINGPVEEIEVTQQTRQDMFDRQETTDDHGMILVGIAKDQNGNQYYKVKNSWDTNQLYGGYFYVSMPYFLAKTLNIMVHKDAVPESIASKMQL